MSETRPSYYDMPYDELRQKAQAALARERELREMLRMLRRAAAEERASSGKANCKRLASAKIADIKSATQAAKLALISEYNERIDKLSEAARKQEEDFTSGVEKLVAQQSDLRERISMLNNELTSVTHQISLLYQQPRACAAREIKRLTSERAARIQELALDTSRKIDEVRAEAQVAVANYTQEESSRRADIALKIAETKEALERLETDAWALNQALQLSAKRGGENENN